MTESRIFNAEAARQEEAELLYGPFSTTPEIYPPFAEPLLKHKFFNPKEPALGIDRQKLKHERAEYWRRYVILEKNLTNLKETGQITTVGEFITAVKDQLSQLREVPYPEYLTKHIDEVTAEATKVFLTTDGHSRLPHLLNDREVHLLAEAVAPLHDILKPLGPESAQLPIDHEVITRQFLFQLLSGLKISLRGELSELTEADVTFVAEVVGDHENLYEEADRFHMLHSDNSADHGKVLFFIPDTLTGLIDSEALEQNEVRLIAGQDRWQDLCFRHSADNGKVFRPEWVTASLQDQQAILHEYEVAGYIVPLETKQTLVDQAIAGVEKAKAQGYAKEQRLVAIETTLEVLAQMKNQLSLDATETAPATHQIS